jgi:hemerythrin-like domain-containing protein
MTDETRAPATGLPGLHAAPAAGFDDPFAMLEGCHERVARMLGLLGRLETHLREQGADVQARQAAADVLRYFDIAAPAHHEDEERHVLPELRADGRPEWLALAARLHDEHERMSTAWGALRPALAALAEGRWPDTGAAQQDEAFDRWRAFAALYDGHIEAEHGVAFPAAAARLDAGRRAAMGAEMAARRGVKVPGVR